MVPDGQPKGRANEDGKAWLAALVQALAVIGVLFYGIQRFSYERFYDQFGITPEDVGINSTHILSQTALGIATFAVIAGFALIPIAVIAGATGRNWRTGLFAGALVLSALVLLGAFLFMTEADDAAKCAAQVDGHPVRSLRVRIPGTDTTITSVGVRADIATLKWIAGRPSGEPKSRRVVYLGTKEGAYIVFDRTKKAVMRVPVGSAVLLIDTTAPRYRIQKGCKPATQP